MKVGRSDGRIRKLSLKKIPRTIGGQRKTIEEKENMDFKKAEEIRNRLLNQLGKNEPNLSIVLDKSNLNFEEDERWNIIIF